MAWTAGRSFRRVLHCLGRKRDDDVDEVADFEDSDESFERGSSTSRMSDRQDLDDASGGEQNDCYPCGGVHAAFPSVLGLVRWFWAVHWRGPYGSAAGWAGFGVRRLAGWGLPVAGPRAVRLLGAWRRWGRAEGSPLDDGFGHGREA